MDIDGYVAAIAGAETAQEACERLTGAGYQATVQDETVVIDDGTATAKADGGINKINDEFFLWCIYDQTGELSRCVARGPHGSCPPRR